MDEKTQARMHTIELLSTSDAKYCQMLFEMQKLEKNYDAVLQTLPNDQQDAVCDFVSQCEEMSWRMLELACKYMHFPE